VFTDPTGELLNGTIHNLVVGYIMWTNQLAGNMRVDYKNSIFWGYCDVVNLSTGEVWEVKRQNLSVPKAQTQLGKYVDGNLHNKDYKNLPLYTGGSKGTHIAYGSFIAPDGFSDYYVEYWDNGNGIIQYEYNKLINWDRVALVGTIIVAGIVYIVTQGAYGPELVPA